MQALLFGLVLFGQAASAPPVPAEIPPAPAPTAAAQTVEEMRTWLLTRLMVDMSFDAQKSTQVKQLLETMNEPQMRALIAAYKERATQQRPVDQTATSTADQVALEQAKLDLQQAQAYRDHLKREYDRQILQGMMQQNLFYQNLIGNQRLMSMTSPYGYGTYLPTPYGISMPTYGQLYYGVGSYGIGNTAVSIGVPLNYGFAPSIQGPGGVLGF